MSDNLRRLIQSVLAPLRRRVQLMVGRAIISALDDSKKLQYCQVKLLAGELRDNLERVQEYGFTSAPQTGAEAVALFVGGNRDHGLIIACDDRRYRVTGLADGEVCIYTDEGDQIHLKRGNEIEITTDKFVINSSEVEINATTSVTITTAAMDINN